MRRTTPRLLVWSCTAVTMGCIPGPEPDVIPVNPRQLVTHDGLYTLFLEPERAPFHAGDTSRLTVQVNAEGQPANECALKITPFMPDHNHGISQPPTIEDIDQSAFQASWMFTMPGYWEVTIEVDCADGNDTAKAAYNVE